MNLSRRLEKLEKGVPNTLDAGRDEAARGRRRRVVKFFDAVTRWRREQAGLPVEPLDYTEEDYRDDLDTLDRIIPQMREARGWQSEEAREFLDTWEATTRERVESHRKHRKEST